MEADVIQFKASIDRLDQNVRELRNELAIRRKISGKFHSIFAIVSRAVAFGLMLIAVLRKS